MQNVIHLEFLLIVLGVALLSAGRARSLAACAAIASGLAAGGASGRSRAAGATLPPGFVAVEAALLAIGGALALGWPSPRCGRRRIAGDVGGSAGRSPVEDSGWS